MSAEGESAAENEGENDSRLPDTPLDKKRSEKDRAELRGTIARRVGSRTNWGTPLDKETLNSTYAYLTGEFFVPRAALHKPDHPDYEPKSEVLLAVVIEAEIGEPGGDEWSTVSGEQPQSLRKDELKKLDLETKKTKDQREWVGGGDDGE